MAHSTTRMPGSTIASPAAGGWVTDFLNTVYFARPARQRDVDDLRLVYEDADGADRRAHAPGRLSSSSLSHRSRAQRSAHL
ncbi:MAG: hypothetical protein MSC31_18235 [Solirubrobacteraceae bacterium MAG38_C4-C5]|nr:hypothetical protein [Candidatus Siliceabacter maunaloa]